MPTMTANGTLTPTPRCLESPTCCGALFYLRATYAELVAALGETDTIEDAEPLWVIRVHAEDNQVAERVSIHHDSNWPRTDAAEPTHWYVTTYRDGRWAAERLAEKLGEIVEFTY